MNLFKRGASILGLLGIAGVAQAELASTLTVTNDYDFRGNSQTAKDPALQGSLDFVSETGWYVGAWGSNVDFGLDDPSIEVDLYGGFTKALDTGWTYDVGLVYYAYPEEGDFDYIEAYGSLAYQWFKGKIWYSPAFGGDAAEAASLINTGTDDIAAWYVEGNATIPLPQNFNVQLHLGYSTGDYWDNVFGDDQIDYSIGVGVAAGKFNLALKYVDTDSDTVVRSDVFNNEGRVIFTAATTLPWK